MQSDDESTIERIESYLDGRLSSVEREAFEQDMAANPDLMRQVQLERVTRLAIQKAYRRHLIGHIKPWSDDSPAQPPHSSFKFWILGLVTIVIGLLLFRYACTVSPDYLQEEHENDASDTNVIIAGSETQADTARTSISRDSKKYSLKKNHISTSVFRLLAQENKIQAIGKSTLGENAHTQSSDSLENDDDRQRRALMLFDSGDYRSAALIFHSLRLSPVKGYDAEWMEMLCYLAQYPDEQEKFRALAQTILGEVDHPWEDKTRELLKRVDLLIKRPN